MKELPSFRVRFEPAWEDMTTGMLHQAVYIDGPVPSPLAVSISAKDDKTLAAVRQSAIQSLKKDLRLVRKYWLWGLKCGRSNQRPLTLHERAVLNGSALAYSYFGKNP